MNNIFSKVGYLILTGMFQMSFQGCSLEEKLHGTTTTDNFIQTENDLTLVVNGVYSVYSEFDLYKSSGLGIILFSGDDLCAHSGATTTTGNPGWYVMRNYDANSDYIKKIWRCYFKAIDNANSAINAISKSPLPDDLKDRTIGEMYFMRGFSYFNLVRAFGGVPLRLEHTTGSSDFYAPRASVDQVYEQIFRDLSYAAEHCIPLSEMSTTELGRATKGAAQGMLALAYLTYGNYCDLYKSGFNSVVYYGNALKYANLVIESDEYELMDDYGMLFDVDNEREAYQKEVIFGVQFARDNVIANAASIGSELANYLQPTERPGICGNTDGRGSQKVLVQPWFVNQYYEDGSDYRSGSEVDYRFNVNFLTDWIGSFKDNINTPEYEPDEPIHFVTYPIVAPKTDTDSPNRKTMPYVDKYKDPDGVDARNHENDLFIMRYAEIFLIKAEAENELNGPTTVAYDAFNEVRKRARKANGQERTVPADLQPGLSQDEFRMAVFNERGLELFAEGHRFFDALRVRSIDDPSMCMLKYRFKVFYPGLSAEQRAAPKVPDSKTGVWAGGIVAPMEGNMFTWTDDDRYLLFPIPSDEILKNPNFGGQNPGW